MQVFPKVLRLANSHLFLMQLYLMRIKEINNVYFARVLVLDDT